MVFNAVSSAAAASSAGTSSTSITIVITPPYRQAHLLSMVRAGAPSITCSSFVNIQGVGVCKSHLLNIRDFSVIAAFVKKLPIPFPTLSKNPSPSSALYFSSACFFASSYTFFELQSPKWLKFSSL